MSKIEVDAIDKQSGSTLTLGGSGTAVTLAAGATQSGFGRTGTVDWQTGSIKTATFTATSGEGYFCNTAGGSFEVDLPAGSAGAIVSIQDYNNTFDSNLLTVDPNGSEKINGGDAGEPVELSTEGQGVTFVYIDATVGWRSVQDNTFATAGQSASFITATGGTITTVCTNFKVHTFTSPGTFCVSCAGNAAGSNTVSYMVVAGGAGGGIGYASGYCGGAGGAGGYRESKSPFCSFTASPLSTCVGLAVSGAIPITVGAGGAGTTGCSGCGNGPNVKAGSNGSNSIFSSITSAGGGGGAGGGRDAKSTVGNGGSGGGGGYASSPAHAAGSGNTPPVSPPQGNNGGTAGPGSLNAGGGGGGATAVGGNASSSNGGTGGAGATSSINATPTVRAGGGGGSSGNTGSSSGGTGGGGAGGNDSPSVNGGAGTVNTGGGGGGGTRYSTAVGGAGGSGIVIIRYKFQ
jgi:hypothetical protein